MYLRLINVKAIERQRDSYILVINNRYEKMGESLYRINKDALEIIRNLNGTKTFDDLVDMMISCHLEKKEQAKYKLNNFLNELEKNPGISVEYLKKTNPIEIPILGNGKTQYPSAISVEITHRCNAKCLHCYGEYCAKKQQMSALAHDIKTPLTIVRGNAELLSETELTTEQKKNITYVLNGTTQIQSYVKQLIDVTKSWN